MTKARRIAALVVVVASVAAFAGCSGPHHELVVGPNISTSTPAAPPRAVGALGVVEGRFLAIGGPAGAAPSPQRGRIMLRRDGRLVVRVVIGQSGLFDFDAPPGRYQLSGLTPQFNINGRQGLCNAFHTVTVRAGGTTHADVYCQRI